MKTSSKAKLSILLVLSLVGCANETPGADDNCIPGDALENCIASGLEEEFCTGQLARYESVPVCDENKSDTSQKQYGTFPGWWWDATEACFESGDYECVHENWKLVAAGGWLKGYPAAAKALLNFLSCNVSELPVTEADLAIPTPYRSAPEIYKNDVAIFTAARSEIQRRALAAFVDGELDSEMPKDLGKRLFSPEGEDWRRTLGRLHLYASAFEVDERVELEWTTYDVYDWAPDGADGAYTYHIWLSKLVEEGYACEFEFRGAWESEIDVGASAIEDYEIALSDERLIAYCNDRCAAQCPLTQFGAAEGIANMAACIGELDVRIARAYAACAAPSIVRIADCISENRCRWEDQTCAEHVIELEACSSLLSDENKKKVEECSDS